MLEIMTYIQLAKISIDLLRELLDLINERRDCDAKDQKDEEEEEGKQ
ncbi:MULTISPECIES: hypothetical protein [unclassified Microcystis]|nr:MULTISPECIES: hypothetical protein [unclassified Microcystis]MCA2928053.1 hypothetical protein [Microcystis sp. M020S1]MCA2937178.1 hypothetical protein [Microcystis sp. M015S1]MCA2620920.1 hypothetical protein [Microcystis sp. M099S2]MCA2652340.1 hypothetical protein [Microcystis sp. M065S2]MCA2681197.1 hypothetical protein [Microcystis sp. M043S2]